MSLCAINNVTTTYLEYFQQGQEEENIMIHNLVYITVYGLMYWNLDKIWTKTLHLQIYSNISRIEKITLNSRSL